MPIKQSRAFVLRTYPVAEADRVCVLFSGDEGKVRAWARGARRPKSRYGGALDIGNEVEAGWFEREGRELVHLDRCELVTSALPLARDPVKAAALGYLSRLVETFAPDREADPKLFRLISACRDALLDDRSAELVVAYFEAWLLRLSGFYPRPGRCACGAGFEREGAVFFGSGPVYACTRCAPGHGEPTDRLSAGAFGLLETFWVAPPSVSAPAVSTVRELFRFHGRLTADFAKREFPARRALEGLLEPRVSPARDLAP